jgi:hypothetical protein
MQACVGCAGEEGCGAVFVDEEGGEGVGRDWLMVGSRFVSQHSIQADT